MGFEAKGAEPGAGARAEATLSGEGSADADAGKEWPLLEVRVWAHAQPLAWGLQIQADLSCLQDSGQIMFWQEFLGQTQRQLWPWQGQH